MNNKILTISIFFAILMGATSVNATDYTIDVGHSNILFKIKHLGISTVTGRFQKFEGTFKYDKKTDKLSDINITIDVSSISTSNEKRDKHLNSPEFFNSKKYPNITFKSTSIKADKKGDFKITGDFSMHGVKKEITLDATLNGTAISPWGQNVISFDASSKLNRQDYKLTWNKALEAGGFLVGEEVKIILVVEGVEKKTRC